MNNFNTVTTVTFPFTLTRGTSLSAADVNLIMTKMKLNEIHTNVTDIKESNIMLYSNDKFFGVIEIKDSNLTFNDYSDKELDEIIDVVNVQIETHNSDNNNNPLETTLADDDGNKIVNVTAYKTDESDNDYNFLKLATFVAKYNNEVGNRINMSIVITNDNIYVPVTMF